MPQVTFVLKEPKSDKPTLVYLLYHFNKNKLKYSTSQKVDPRYWNPEKQRAKEIRGFQEHKNFNFVLDKLETAVNDAYRKLIIEDIKPTPDILRDAVDQTINKKESPKKTFIAFAERVLESSDRTQGTKKGVRQTLNILREYEKQNRSVLVFDSIDLDFYNNFVDFLAKRNLKQSTIGNHIKNIKVFMREAFERHLTKNVQFKSKRFKKLEEEAQSIFLTQEELNRIYSLDLTHAPRLDKVRDLFLVACYTGLRFSDLVQITPESINGERKLLKIKTQKTGEIVIIPINSVVRSIIDKYEGNLPVAISNQKMNDYLKEIAELAEIQGKIERVSTKGGKRVREVFDKHELVTVHTARRSFATNAYQGSVPSIGIMKITGHRTEKSFLKYIKISQEDNANRLLHHPFFA